MRKNDNLLRYVAASSLAFALIGSPVFANEAPLAAQAPGTQGPRMPNLPPAEIDNTLVVGGEEIDARKLRTRMTVQVFVNDSGPHRFVVDSGADTSVVGERIARSLSLAPAPARMLNGVTESRIVDHVKVDELRLGPSQVYNLKVPVLREFDIGAAGMIGLDALVEQRLMLDFDKRVITVEDATRPPPRLDGEIVVRAKLKRGQLILTQLRADRIPIDAIVDTGSEITIGNLALRALLFERRPDEVRKIKVYGVTGAAVDLDLIQVRELKIGSITLTDVPIAFADIPPFEVFGIAKEPALLLGTDLMEAFRKVALDFRARKVRFQLKKCDPSTIVLSTAVRYATRLSSNEAATCS